MKRILVIEETNKEIAEYVERFVKVLHALLLKVSSSAVALLFEASHLTPATQNPNALDSRHCRRSAKAALAEDQDTWDVRFRELGGDQLRLETELGKALTKNIPLSWQLIEFT